MKNIPFIEGIKEFKNIHFKENEILFKELVEKGQNRFSDVHFFLLLLFSFYFISPIGLNTL